MGKRVVITVLCMVVVGSIAWAIHFWWVLGDNVGYAPEQPIPFSHKRHAGENQIPCQYCHVGIETSKHATVPAMNICMNCHRVVKTESPHIKKLTEMYDKGEPIPWIRVHDLPDHARFNHSRHIHKGIACEACHGDVKSMNRIEQKKTLQMGFCLDCHRKPEIHASINCQSCHY